MVGLALLSIGAAACQPASLSTTPPANHERLELPPAVVAPSRALDLEPGARPVVGTGYRFKLRTHCGVDWRTYFDGSYWDLVDRAINGLDNPEQYGIMTLTSRFTARFEYTHGWMTFKRHDEAVPLKPPAGCD